MLAGFPAGPYRLRGRFVLYRLLGVVLCALAGVACVIIYGKMGADGASLILHDQKIWGAGGSDLPANVEGEVTTSQFVLNSYDLKVRYSGPNGQPRERPLKFDSLGAIDDSQAPTVRLSPSSADDFALSSAVAASGKRWAAAAFFGAVGIFLLGGSCVFLAFAASKQWRRAQHAARQGVPMSCQLIARERVLNQGKDTGAEKLTFRVAAGPGSAPQDVSYQLRTKGSEVITLDGGAAVLALVPADAPERAILMLRDFYPIELGSEQQKQAEQALGRG